MELLMFNIIINVNLDDHDHEYMIEYISLLEKFIHKKQLWHVQKWLKELSEMFNTLFDPSKFEKQSSTPTLLCINNASSVF